MSLKPYTLIGVYASGKGAKEVFQGLVSHMHRLAHENGANVLLVPLDYSSTRHYALPYWNGFTTELATVAKRFGVDDKGPPHTACSAPKTIDSEP